MLTYLVKTPAVNMVSSATGFLDFLSYMSAAAATTIGWGWLILVWFGLMIFCVVIALPYKNNIAKFASFDCINCGFVL